MALRQPERIDWPWLAGVSVRMAGIILLGMLLAAGVDAFLALIGGVFPLMDGWARRLESGSRTLLHLTALATAILYGLLSARRAG